VPLKLEKLFGIEVSEKAAGSGDSPNEDAASAS